MRSRKQNDRKWRTRDRRLLKCRKSKPQSSDSEADVAQNANNNSMNVRLSSFYSERQDPENSNRQKGGDKSVTLLNSTIKGDKRTPRKRRRQMKESDVDPLPKIVTEEVEISTSKFTFKDFGGYEAQLTEICKLIMHMKHPEVFTKLGVKPPRGFLLHGPPGCGKTLLAHAIAGEFGLSLLKLTAPELVSGISGDSEKKIRNLFSKATAVAPCILFIDEIDAVTQKRETVQREMDRRIVCQLIACIDDLENSDQHVLFIGATSRPESMDPSLRMAGRFDREIAFGMPDEHAREKILRVLCKQIHLPDDFDYSRLARLCPGFVGADLKALISEACISAIRRVFTAYMPADSSQIHVRPDWSAELEKLVQWLKSGQPYCGAKLEDLFVSFDDFEVALKHVQPSAKREGFATVPDVTWQDVGALNHIREELKWSILYPVKMSKAFSSMGLNDRAQGILLCGPPGCGKTLLAKAIANESGINFISVKGPELLNMYVGESERAVRQVFQRAKNSSPCVIFFDEIDALCPRRSHSDNSGGSRLVNQLLTEMDGVESRRHVFIMAATNRPDIIDPAMLRPGRLDKILFVGLPNAQDKVSILNAITKNKKMPPIDAGVNFARVASDPRCDSFSGADLEALVREAAVVTLRQCMQLQTGCAENPHPPLVKWEHFDRALSKVHSSISQQDAAEYKRLSIKYSGSITGRV